MNVLALEVATRTVTHYSFYQNQVYQETQLNGSKKSVSIFGKILGCSILFITEDRNVIVMPNPMRFPELTFQESIRSFPSTGVKTGVTETSNDTDNGVKLKVHKNLSAV